MFASWFDSLSNVWHCHTNLYLPLGQVSLYFQPKLLHSKYCSKITVVYSSYSFFITVLLHSSAWSSVTWQELVFTCLDVALFPVPPTGLMPVWTSSMDGSNTPSQYTLSTHPLNTSYQHTLSIYPLNPPCNTHSHPTKPHRLLCTLGFRHRWLGVLFVICTKANEKNCSQKTNNKQTKTSKQAKK